MIWQSLPVMTVIDLAIVSAACYLIYLLRRHHRSAQQLGLVPVLNVILAGVGLTALFYGSDLFIMYVLPLITSKPHAMQTMVALNLNVRWISTLISLGLIVGGVAYLLRDLIPRTAALTDDLEKRFEASRKNLEATINTLQREVMDRDRVELDLQEQIQQQRVITEFARIFQKTNDLNQALDQAVQLIANAFKVEFCKLLLQREGGDFLLAGGCGWKEGLVHNATVPADPASQAGYTLAINAPVIVKDLDRETRFSGPAILIDHGIKSGLSIPMISRGEPIGVLGVHSSQHRAFTIEEGHFLQTLSAFIATAIEHQRADAALREAHAHLEFRVRERTTELEKANTLLNREVAERKKAEAALRKTQERFRLQLESTQVIPWEADAKTFQFTYVGPQAADLLGFPVEHWHQTDFWQAHIHPKDRESAVEHCRRSSQNATNFEFEYRMISADNRVVWINDIVHVVHSNGRPSLLRGFMIDITKRKEAEDALEKETSFVKLLQEITAASNKTQSVSEVLQTTIDSVCAHTGWPVGHAYLLDQSKKELYPGKIWHLDHPERFDSFRKVTEATRFSPGVGLPGRILNKGRASWITDVKRDPNFPRAREAKDIGVHAAFGFPVLIGKEVVAVLEFFSEHSSEPDTELLEAMTHIGVQLGRVIERERS